MRDAVLASAPTTEVCVARKRARGPESRRLRRHACRALCHALVGLSAACRARVSCALHPIGFLPFPARDGARFAAGFANRGCGLPRLGFCEFRVRIERFAAGCTGQIGKFTGQIRIHGFFLSPIQITPVRRCFLRLVTHRRHARSLKTGRNRSWVRYGKLKFSGNVPLFPIS